MWVIFETFFEIFLRAANRFFKNGKYLMGGIFVFVGVVFFVFSLKGR